MRRTVMVNGRLYWKIVKEMARDARKGKAMEKPKTKSMRHCFNCGAELGIYVGRDYHPLDTCGKQACERAAHDAVQRERQEAHEQLDRDLGW